MSNTKKPRQCGKIELTKEECYCSIEGLYTLIAKKLGYSSFNVKFDCRKICVTKAVMDQIFAYYADCYKVSKESIAQAWLMYGPKANIWESGYAVAVQNGFALEEEG